MSTPVRAGIIAVAAVDAGVRVWALRDLRSRDKSQVNGSKLLWSAGLSTVNSAGILPALYLLRGRKASAADAE
ncbi:MAG: hypothetical protein WBG39_08820 [Gordonia sp. (in: high G+C Gram-positive bacteria)]